MDEAERFARCLPLILKHEGGYVNHPRDPGGATNRGVTQRTYDAWRRSQGKPARSVKAIGESEVAAIYRKSYWLLADCDVLPAGVDYMIFDLAVNSGVSRAARMLQEVVGVPVDAKIGPKTLAAVMALQPLEVVRRLRDRRERFYRGLSTFDTFGKGWLRRLSEVSSQAEAWARS